MKDRSTGDELQDGAACRDQANAGAWQAYLRMAWRWKWLLLAGGLVGLVIGYLRTPQSRPSYSSSADLLVVKKRPNALPVANVESGPVEEFDDFLETHLELLRSPLILERAVRRLQAEHPAILAGTGNAVAFLRGSFSVTRARPGQDASAPGGRILHLTVQGPTAEDAALVLQAVIDGYKEYLDATYQNSSGETVKLIQEARQVLDHDLARKTAEYREFRQNAPVFYKGKNGTNAYQETFSAAQSRRAGIQIRRAELLGLLEALEKARREGHSAPELAQLFTQEFENSTPTTSLQDRLYPMLLKEQRLAANFGRDYPDLVAVREEIEFTRNFYAQRSSDPLVSSERQSAQRVDAYVQSLKRELNSLQTQQRALDGLIEQEHGEAHKLTSYDVQDELLRGELTRTQQLYDSIVKRLQEVNLVKDLGGFEAVVVSPPSSGSALVGSERRQLPLAAALGLVAAAALAYVLELRDKRFRSPEEISRLLDVPVMGHLPLAPVQSLEALRKRTPAGIQPDPTLCSHYRPHSAEAESYRSLRTALFSRMRREGDRVLQITSPARGDGKSTLAANLAVSIAQSGVRTLLIDADLRRPRLHRLLGTSRNVGLTSYLTEKVDLAAAIQQTGIPGLSFLPSGPNVPNPAELLTAPRLKEALQGLRETYDFVIIDTPPILAVTDPCVVAQHADAVLLTVHVARTGRPLAERAKEVLDSAGAYVLGVVVNAVERSLSYGSYYRHDEFYDHGPGYSAAEVEAETHCLEQPEKLPDVQLISKHAKKVP